MIDQDIIEKLVYFTDEELDNLNGKSKIDRSIFLNSFDDVVDCNKILEKDEQFAIRKHARFAAYPKHRHNYLELLYVYSGTMTNVIENQRVVVNEGDLIFLNQNVPHEIEYTNENDIVFNFIIKPEFLEFVSSLNGQCNEVFAFLIESLYSSVRNGEYFVFKLQNSEVIKNYIDDIVTTLYRGPVNHKVKLKLLMGLLLVELASSTDYIVNRIGNDDQSQIMEKVYYYIKNCYTEGSLQALADALDLSDYCLSKIIKKHTDQTFKQLIQRQRLKQAIILLQSTHLPVAEIVCEVGYENVTHFYRIFKSAYQVTPSIYRERYRGAKNDKVAPSYDIG